MSTYIDMMVQGIEPALARRLELLTGEDPACCVRDLRAEAAEVRTSARFAAAIERAKALSDESRLLALGMIRRNGEMCACEVQAALEVSHATVSHHMRVLVDAGLVQVERRGKWAYYSVAKDALPLVP